jgi:hypothetical protein
MVVRSAVLSREKGEEVEEVMRRRVESRMVESRRVESRS